jgi:uncharacterized membrane protein
MPEQSHLDPWDRRPRDDGFASLSGDLSPLGDVGDLGERSGVQNVHNSHSHGDAEAPGAEQFYHAHHSAEHSHDARLRAIGDATLYAIRRHWLAGINVLLGSLIGVAILTPVGYALGLTAASDAVFHAYRFICGQTPSHTFYVFGYQMCLCTRCLAIYSSLLAAGLLLALTRHTQRIRALAWPFWLLAMVPMALDGGTQLIGLRESNIWLRLLTGAIFGFATAWFLFPQIDEASRDAEPAPAPARP